MGDEMRQQGRQSKIQVGGGIKTDDTHDYKLMAWLLLAAHSGTSVSTPKNKLGNFLVCLALM